MTVQPYPKSAANSAAAITRAVMHAVRKIEELMAEDPHITQDVEVIRRALTG